MKISYITSRLNNNYNFSLRERMSLGSLAKNQLQAEENQGLLKGFKPVLKTMRDNLKKNSDNSIKYNKDEHGNPYYGPKKIKSSFDDDVLNKTYNSKLKEVEIDSYAKENKNINTLI